MKERVTRSWRCVQKSLLTRLLVVKPPPPQLLLSSDIVTTRSPGGGLPSRVDCCRRGSAVVRVSFFRLWYVSKPHVRTNAARRLRSLAALAVVTKTTRRRGEVNWQRGDVRTGGPTADECRPKTRRTYWSSDRCTACGVRTWGGDDGASVAVWRRQYTRQPRRSTETHPTGRNRYQSDCHTKNIILLRLLLLLRLFLISY